jgi:hypothetical protein
MLNESHAPERQGDVPLRILIARMRRDGYGGRPGRMELLSGIDGVSSQPVRRFAGGGCAKSTAGSMRRVLSRQYSNAPLPL